MRELIKEILYEYIFEELLVEENHFIDKIKFNDKDSVLDLYYNDHSVLSSGHERVPIDDIMDLIYEYQDDFFNTVKQAVLGNKKGVIVVNNYSPIPPYNERFEFHCWVSKTKEGPFRAIINTSIYSNRGLLEIRQDSRPVHISKEGNYFDDLITKARLERQKNQKKKRPQGYS
jgi:hypothetical protein